MLSEEEELATGGFVVALGCLVELRRLLQSRGRRVGCARRRRPPRIAYEYARKE